MINPMLPVVMCFVYASVFSQFQELFHLDIIQEQL
jgi:hypothetical protein